MLTTLCSFLFATTQCNVNEELTVCRNELIDLADRIRLSTLEHPSWSHLFEIQGKEVAKTLNELAETLAENSHNCPCTGPCTNMCEESEDNHLQKAHSF